VWVSKAILLIFRSCSASASQDIGEGDILINAMMIGWHGGMVHKSGAGATRGAGARRCGSWLPPVRQLLECFQSLRDPRVDQNYTDTACIFCDRCALDSRCVHWMLSWGQRLNLCRVDQSAPHDSKGVGANPSARLPATNGGLVFSE